MTMTGLNRRVKGIAAVVAFVLGAAGAWALAQQSSPPGATAAKPPAATPAPSVQKSPAAKPQKTKPLWRDLSRAQQEALAPLAREWDQLDVVRKRKWLQLANRFKSMKPEEQQRVQDRMREWVKLSPGERARARETYSRARKLPPGEKAATWESYQQLPDDQKKKLAAGAGGKPGAKRAEKPAQSRAAEPAPQASPACPAGTTHNQAGTTPACVPLTPAPASPASPVVPPTAPSASPPPTITPVAPASPSPNANF
jgi:hypothetical protein